MTISLSAILGREKAVSDRLPYSALASSHNIRTSEGDMLSVVKLAGAAHEAADVEEVFAWHESLHGMLLNIAAPDLAIWRHTFRREIEAYPKGEPHSFFASEFNERYRDHFTRERMMVNDLYLTFVLKGPPRVLSLFGKASQLKREDVIREINEQSARLDELVEGALANLSRYSPQRLGNYEHASNTYNSALEFLGELVNGTWSRVPLPRGRIADALPTSRLSFGVESGESRGPVSSKVFAMVSITEYPEVTETGLLNQLLSLPFEFVATQSFTLFPKQKAADLIARQERKLINTKDAAESQIDALRLAADDVASNRVGIGEHHLSVLVSADDETQLVKRISQVAANLGDAGFTVVREDLALEAGYWAQLPANFKYRPRPAPITTRNFAGLIALHNYPVGQASNNEWGPALMVVKSTSGGPYFLNLHLPKRGVRADSLSEEDEADQRVPGNTFLCGPTGAGKTVVQGSLITMAEKYRPTTFTFDKDNGLEVLIRALGGQYRSLRIGEPTGFNPFQAPDSPQHRAFLEALVTYCATAGGMLSAKVQFDIANAVRSTMELPFESRRLAVCRQFLDPSETEGAYVRLGRWCGPDGPLAWVLDNPRDTLNLSGTRHFGFDVTHFLGADEVRVPIIMVLFNAMESLIGKTRTMVNVAEFWKVLQDPWLESKVEDLLKTIRKRDGILFLETQSPRDAINSRISHTVIEQCVSQIYLPSPKAKKADYCEGFGLSDREFEIVKHEMPNANLRGFLFKQGATSVVCELNLKGFDEELAVLSATAYSTELCHKAIERVGPDPEAWLPVFDQLRRG